jgi:hypothetical protein
MAMREEMVVIHHLVRMLLLMEEWVALVEHRGQRLRMEAKEEMVEM